MRNITDKHVRCVHPLNVFLWPSMV